MSPSATMWFIDGTSMAQSNKIDQALHTHTR